MMKDLERVTKIIQDERGRKLHLLALWERRLIGEETMACKSIHGREGLMWLNQINKIK